MSLDKRNFKRPNSDKILAAPASQTGGLKGIIAGTLKLVLNHKIKSLF